MTAGAIFRSGRHRRWLAIILAVLIPTPIAAVVATAESSCTTSGPSGNAYAVTVCLAPPADPVQGNVSVSATVTVTGANPGVRRVVFLLDGSYLLTDYQAPYVFELPSTRFVDGPTALAAQALMRDEFTSATAAATIDLDNGITSPPVTTGTFQPSTGRTAGGGQPFVVAAFGDGASGETAANAVSDLVVGWQPNLFLYLGDVYEKGTYTEFVNWYGKDDTFLGRIRDVTNPVIGNHEYEGGSAPGYIDYWGRVPDYYSYDAGGWHFIALNSTTQFAQRGKDSAQYRWLVDDLAANTGECTIAYFHHPVFSVGPQGDAPSLGPIWSLLAESGVDIVLTGHDHSYQRWVPLDPKGDAAVDGTTQFVVGAGGHGVQPFTRTDPRLAAGFDTTAAVGSLRLELGQAGATFGYHDRTGAVLDSGSVACHAGGDTTAPSAPSDLRTTAVAHDSVALAWSAATDDVGVTGYDILRDGSLVGQSSTTTWIDSTVGPSTNYGYAVQARDAAGNIGPATPGLTVTTAAPPPATPTPTPTPPPTGALFEDDFESGGLRAWAGVTGLVVSAVPGATGSWAARATSTGPATWAYRQLAADEQELYYRLRFRRLSQGDNTTYLLRFRSGASSLLGVYLTNTGRLGLRNDIAASGVTSSIVVDQTGWHTLEVRLRTDGAASSVETWYDGAPVAALSRAETYGTQRINRIQLGENAAGRTYDIAFDDVTVSRTRLP